VPPVKVRQPEELVRLAGAAAEQLGKSLDAFYAEAIDRYIEVTKHATAGAARSRLVIPRASPRVTIEVPDELLERAEAAADRLEKKPEVLYADALARALSKLGSARPPAAEGALNQGHDLPSGAWRKRDPT
jgi:hypothetical protein